MPLITRLQKTPIFYIRIAIAVVIGAAIIGGIVYASRPNLPPTSTLGPGAHMGAVEIFVKDPAVVSEFYQDGVGLQTINTEEDSITLGTGDTPLMILTRSDAAGDNPTSAGLYHSAFLFESESALANTLARIGEQFPASFQGSADHSVSMAFYFSDPEGSGVELYVDRPSDEWQWNADNTVTMGSYALDPNEFIAQHTRNMEPVQPGITMGHVHLRVGNLDDAERFYVDSLGMSVTAHAKGATFFSANGYHHHIGTNTWSSAGAGIRPESRGLGTMNIHVTREQDLVALTDRLDATSVSYERIGETVQFADPWGNTIVVSLSSSAK